VPVPTDSGAIDLSDLESTAEPQPAPSVPSVPSDAPLAQDEIHTGYGTVDAPRDGESIVETVTADGTTLRSYDYEGDGIVDGVSADFTDGTGAGYYDGDKDGSFDSVYYTDADGNIVGSETDSDGDGRIDTVYDWTDDDNHVVYRDEDGDGLADTMFETGTGDYTELT